MRVGYVVRYWPTLSETFIAREIRALAAQGWAPEVVALGRRRDAAPGEPVGVPVHRPPRGLGSVGRWPLGAACRILAAPARYAALVGAGGKRRGLRTKDALRVIWLAELARARGWDRLHAHFAGESAEWARAAAALVGRPYSVTVHGADLFRPKAGLRRRLAGARPLVAICEHHRRWLARHYGLSATVVRCGVEPAAYPAAAPGRADAGPHHWVSVARDVPQKGLDDLVAAWREAGRPGRLRLVTDGVRHGGVGIAAGPLPAARVPDVLARSRAFVLPCRVAPDGARDGIPVALMEAMAAGLPVITTPVAGIPELVDDTVGWLVPPGDRRALARVLREVAASPEARARRGAAGRDRIRAQEWTVERQVEELRRLWG